MRRLAVPLALAALLAGCASDEDFRRADEAACTGYGFQPSSTEFAACLQRETLARRYDRPAFYGWYGVGGFYAAPPFW